METVTEWEWALVPAYHLGKCCRCWCTSTNSSGSTRDSCQMHHESCNLCRRSN